MKKITSLLALFIAVPTLTSCSNDEIQPSVIDENIKESFTSIREQTDEFNGAFSKLSSIYDDSLESRRSINKLSQEQDYNASISNSVLHEFMAEEYFGLYVFSCVNYCVQYLYEPNGINIGDKIWGQVTNELNESYREFLKVHNGSTNFYFQLEEVDNDLVFYVDWQRQHNVPDVPDDYNYHGCTRVDGLIKRNDNNDVEELYIANYLDNDSHHISCSHYDFINKKVQLFTARHNGKNKFVSKEIVNAFNGGTLNYQKIKDYHFNRVLIASSNLTNDYSELDYDGYLYTFNDNGEEIVFEDGGALEPSFENKYNEVYDSIYDFSIRDDRNSLKCNEHRRVNFLDKSLEYGLAKTKLYIDSKNAVHLAFIEKSDLLNRINSYKETATDENVLNGLNSLHSKIEGVKDVDYMSSYNKNGFVFNTIKGKNYWHNAYKCEDFYYTYGGESFNGLLVIRVDEQSFTNVVFNIKHKYNDDGGWGTPSTPVKTYESYQDGRYLLETEIEDYYGVCEICGEMIPTYRIESINVVSLDKTTRIFEVQYLSYEYDYDLCVFKPFSGFKYEYEYDEYNDRYECVYSAQLECNENTNYEIYPMYEYFYDNYVTDDGDKTKVVKATYFKNNWLKTSTVFFDAEVEVEKVATNKFNLTSYFETNTMYEGVYYRTSQMEGTYELEVTRVENLEGFSLKRVYAYTKQWNFSTDPSTYGQLLGIDERTMEERVVYTQSEDGVTAHITNIENGETTESTRTCDHAYQVYENYIRVTGSMDFEFDIKVLNVIKTLFE